jgi:hypothetical protein
MANTLRFTLLVQAVCAISCGPAMASSWHYIHAGNEDTHFYFDAETLEKSRDTTTLWIKTVQTNRAADDGSWANALRWKLNCTKRTIQTLAMSTYDREGKFIRLVTPSGQETAAVPDSSGEAVVKIACDPSFPRDTSSNKYFKLENNDPMLATKNYVEFLKSQIDSAPK